ncbi:MAG: hypothetical protein HDS66_05775 [Bacteroidales bacterium]|nr:hypothetical protein [Bacteroidales bacterium]
MMSKYPCLYLSLFVRSSEIKGIQKIVNHRIVDESGGKNLSDDDSNFTNNGRDMAILMIAVILIAIVVWIVASV